MAIESKNKDFDYISVESFPFDNNEIVVTEDEAIQIALKEEEKIETNKIIDTTKTLTIYCKNRKCRKK